MNVMLYFLQKNNSFIRVFTAEMKLHVTVKQSHFPCMFNC